MAAQWYCKISGKTIGPLSSQKLKMLADKGQLRPDHSIRQGSQGNWVPAKRVKGLFPAGDVPPAESDSTAMPVDKPLEEPPVSASGRTPSPSSSLPAPPAPPKVASIAAPVADEFNIVTEDHIRGTRAGGRAISPPADARKRRRKKALLGALILLVIAGAVGGGIWVTSRGNGGSKAGKPEALAAGSAETPEDLSDLDVDRGDGSLAGAAGDSEPRQDKADEDASSEEAEEDEWQDASKSGLKRGDVMVTIRSAAVGLPESARRARQREIKECLLVSVELHNSGKTRKLDYRGWTPSRQVTLTDDIGNEYRRRVFRTALSGGQRGSPKSLYPRKSLRDLLVFEPPVESAKFLRLELSADTFGAEGMLRFQIPMSMLTTASEAADSDTAEARDDSGEPARSPSSVPEAIVRGIAEVGGGEEQPSGQPDQPDAAPEADAPPDGKKEAKEEEDIVSKVNEDTKALGGGDKDEADGENDFERILKDDQRFERQGDDDENGPRGRRTRKRRKR